MNLAYVSALKAAKDYLHGPAGMRMTKYICIALDVVVDRRKALPRTVCALQNEIHRRLDNEITVEDWLFENAGVNLYWSEHSMTGRREVQAYRHRWLDALIEEYSK